MINLYSIKSKSSGLYDTLFPCENDARAVYELRYLINSVKDSAISADPSDHSLIRVGLFDNEHGKLRAQHDVVVKDLSSLVKKVGD